MVTVFPLSQSNMLGFTLDGEVDEEGMRRLLTAAEAKVLTHGKLRLLGNIKNLGGVSSYQSFWDTLKAKRELFGKVERYAILTDQAWLSALASGVDWLSGDMEVKVFGLAEGEVAHQWLGRERKAGGVDSVREVALENERLLGLSIRGQLTKNDYDRINRLIGEKVSRYGRARLLVEIDQLEGVTARALWEDLRAALRFYSDLERVAVVGDQGWLKTSIKVGDLLTPGVDMASFATADRQRAISWLA